MYDNDDDDSGWRAKSQPIYNATTSVDQGTLNVDITTIRILHYGWRINIETQIKIDNSKKYQTLFYQDFEMCKVLNERFRENLIRIWFRNILKYGNLMENCPVPIGRYYVRNMRLETKGIPAYLRPGDYRMNIYNYYGKRKTKKEEMVFLLVVTTAYGLCQDYLPPDVEDYVIMSQCAHNKAINLAAEGTVSVTDISQTQNITIVGRPDFVNNNFKIALYAKETQRYLCFNDHWKLVGMKELQDTCYFNEAIVHGYFVFRSVVDLQRRIGFTQRGRAVGPKKIVNDACYMFTKIPTDQFFHQHTHFSAPKTKSTTTKIPKTEYTHPTPYTNHAGRGSGGGGRTKTNRFKNPQRQDDSVTHNHSGNGHGSGGGSGGGSGNGNKKFKKQRNGHKQRQQKQEMQQQQQQIRGHSYNLSNPKNSTYLNSSRQNLVLSQHSINNHTNKKHNNNNNNNSNNNNHPPQNHQVRHHHNDPNKVARRQQHDQKQKTKLRQRVRPSPSASAAVTSAVASTTTTTTTSLTTAKAINSSKPHPSMSSSYSDINPTSVIPLSISTDATSDSRNTMSSTVVVAKRKGRRRKGDKIHKKSLQKKLELEREHSTEQTDREHMSSSSIGPSYDEEEEFLTSSTDYAWMTNDIMLSSVKPTSASLPTWETWYPSSSTSYTDEDSDYSLGSSATASTITETNIDRRFFTTLESSSMTTDLNKNNLSSQTSVPLPTSGFTSTLTENSIDETISPTVTTDLGTTTTNTSTYTQTDFWSTSLNDNTDADTVVNGFPRETFNTYATPKLENTQNTLNTNEDDEAIWEDTNTALSTQHSKDDLENSTAAITLSTVEDDNVEDEEISSPSTDRTTDEISDTTWTDSSTREMTSSWEYDKASEAATSTTTSTTYTNDCAYSTASTHNGSKTMTDCMFATNTTAPIANNNHKQGETFPTQNYKVSKMETANKVTTSSTTLNSIPIRSDKTTSLPETTSTTIQTQPSLLEPSSVTTFKLEHPVEKSVTTPFARKSPQSNTAVVTSATTAFSSTIHSTKAPAPAAPLSTRKTLRKSTQRLLATPFHQLTYVRNEAGDIDIDSIDNISIYPELLDNDNDEPLVKPSTSRLTMISGYLPTSATATLPESIRIAKIKINRERKRMLRLRNVGNYA
ncbi:hypothetical protein FF38_12315 [Lucilia cuprina]|uniref:Uncharacterized protein n=1 Tax=Lucilia cuprina TaxID=7375 RepID=A0A0L0C5I5_LUCCU|nr:hypothetical protein FF38_12315 [Lucilia cuprina]